ncbi:MAG: hypothetical protein JSV45_12130 [Chromatiales bacterium]|nr:MAG: hypothetical protein JSV45_12130 [Chromatiales bacterium]
MSDIKHSDTLITNEATLQRRKWVERAIAGVRGRQNGSDALPDMREKSPRPPLFVVGSRRSR